MKAGRDPLVQEQRRQEQDHQGLESPQQHVQAGGDRRQADQAEGIRKTWVEETQSAQQRRAFGPQRDPLATHEDGQDREAGSELDRKQRERRDLRERGLADDRPDTPAGGGEDQGGEVTRGDRTSETTTTARVRRIATALVEQAITNSIERATSAGTAERSMAV